MSANPFPIPKISTEGEEVPKFACDKTAIFAMTATSYV
jgi:hypothetical protein